MFDTTTSPTDASPREPSPSRPAVSEAPGERPDLLEIGARQRSPLQRAGLVLLALGFFALGVVCWLIPLATGLPFHFLGLVTLGMASDRVGRTVNRWERKLPERWSLTLRRMLPRIRRGTEAGAEPE